MLLEIISLTRLYHKIFNWFTAKSASDFSLANTSWWKARRCFSSSNSSKLMLQRKPNERSAKPPPPPPPHYTHALHEITCIRRRSCWESLREKRSPTASQRLNQAFHYYQLCGRLGQAASLAVSYACLRCNQRLDWSMDCQRTVIFN